MSDVDWQLPEAPPQINTIGMLHAVAGVLNLFTAGGILFAAVVQGLLTFGIGCLCGFPALVLGPLALAELYSAYRHLSGNHAGMSAPRTLAIAEMVSVVFGGFLPMILGFATMMLLNDKDVEAYYYRVSKASLPVK